MASEMVFEKLYRALLWAYPREHRREYAEPMVQLFRDRMRRDGGWTGTLVVWTQLMFDLIPSAFKERREAAMLDRGMLGRATRRSTGFLLRSLVVSVILYLGITVVVMVAGLVSLLTGWYPFAIESGPLAFISFWATLWSSTTARTSTFRSSSA